MTHDFSILIVGLGGQGALLLSRIIATAATSTYKFVCRSESRGLSQRGGSVSTVVRCTTRPVAPTIGEGAANVLLALDSMEAARNVQMLSDDGVIISKDEYIAPLHLERQWETEVDGKSKYIHLKEELQNILSRYRCRTFSVRARLSQSNPADRINLFMLGAATKHIPIELELLESAIVKCVKPQDRDSALKAYRVGLDSSTAFDEISSRSAMSA